MSEAPAPAPVPLGDEELSTKLAEVLTAFDAAAGLWTALAVDVPDLATRLPLEHVAAVPEEYLDLRYHLAALARTDVQGHAPVVDAMHTAIALAVPAKPPPAPVALKPSVPLGFWARLTALLRR